MGDRSDEYYKYIRSHIIPKLQTRVVKAQEHYGDTFMHLGVKGQFVEINGKYWTLRRFLWEDKQPTREDVDEILYDMIGHCLLILALRHKGDSSGEIHPGSRDD